MGKNTREITPPFPLPNCLITKAGNLATVTGINAKVTFDTVISSYRIGFNVGTNDITIFEDGIYQLGFWGTWVGNAVGARVFRILINGNEIGRYQYSAPIGATNLPMGITLPPIILNVNDIVSATVTQTSGGNLNFTAGLPAPYPLLSVVKLSGLTT